MKKKNYDSIPDIAKAFNKKEAKKDKKMTDEDIDKMIRKKIALNQANALKQRKKLQPLFDKLDDIKKQLTHKYR